MTRLKNKIVAGVAARMTGDQGAVAENGDLVDEAFRQHVAKAILCGNRIIVRAIADERQGRDLCLAPLWQASNGAAGSSRKAANPRFYGTRYGFRENAENWHAMVSKTRAEGLGTEVKRRILLGTYALSAGYHDKYYLKALKVRTLVKQDFDKALSAFDLLMAPTMPNPAFKIGGKN